MENQEDQSSQNEWEKEGKRFLNSTLQYVSDNFIAILTIMFLIAIITGIRNGCRAVEN